LNLGPLRFPRPHRASHRVDKRYLHRPVRGSAPAAPSVIAPWFDVPLRPRTNLMLAKARRLHWPLGRAVVLGRLVTMPRGRLHVGRMRSADGTSVRLLLLDQLMRETNRFPLTAQAIEVYSRKQPRKCGNWLSFCSVIRCLLISGSQVRVLVHPPYFQALTKNPSNSDSELAGYPSNFDAAFVLCRARSRRATAARAIGAVRGR
jgi:hypothetical protein